jgi:hypothetical protein
MQTHEEEAEEEEEEEEDEDEEEEEGQLQSPSHENVAGAPKLTWSVEHYASATLILSFCGRRKHRRDS